MSWNCNGWSMGKMGECARVLHYCSRPPDVLVLVETKRRLVGEVMPGFTTEAALQSPLRDAAQGGIAVALGHRCRLLSAEVGDCFVAASVYVTGIGPMVVGGVYIPPK